MVAVVLHCAAFKHFTNQLPKGHSDPSFGNAGFQPKQDPEAITQIRNSSTKKGDDWKPLTRSFSCLLGGHPFEEWVFAGGKPVPPLWGSPISAHPKRTGHPLGPASESPGVGVLPLLRLDLGEEAQRELRGTKTAPGEVIHLLCFSAGPMNG